MFYDIFVNLKTLNKFSEPVLVIATKSTIHGNLKGYLIVNDFDKR